MSFDCNRLRLRLMAVLEAALVIGRASVTVVAASSMIADVWATALMVQGSLAGVELARR
ncbi:FAD:protein FMN transferase [Ancylobacter pratisalsi]|uniref:FAD:protein FMN transferase n=1 Tax=Ancylobacter pratisalsi TaxID=1745854 RepID=A0A6P1YN48_9HYPH|nr:FAD:protein FMN transferase [Ancylobacter pratisalsi]